jgi:hypothetical protein
MSHPMYEAGYSTIQGIIDLAFHLDHIWMPFLLMIMIISIIGWLHTRAVGGGDADHLFELHDAHVAAIQDTPDRWDRLRRRKKW